VLRIKDPGKHTICSVWNISKPSADSTAIGTN
jgi:hypothetical protein